MGRMLIFFHLIVLSFPEVAYPQSISDTRPSGGKASYYAKKFQGRKTASGELFNNFDYTAAHRTLPFNTYVNVINTQNHYNIIVRVNDRGPFTKSRVIDLTEAAARRIGSYHQGLVHVRLEVLNLLQMTPELEKMYHAFPIVDCLGNDAAMSGFSLSLWSTGDLVHAIYVANDLFLKESVDRVLIGIKETAGKKQYHIIISGIENRETAVRLKSEYEQKGFMKVAFYTP